MQEHIAKVGDGAYRVSRARVTPMATIYADADVRHIASGNAYAVYKKETTATALAWATRLADAMHVDPALEDGKLQE